MQESGTGRRVTTGETLVQERLAVSRQQGQESRQADNHTSCALSFDDQSERTYVSSLVRGFIRF